MYPLMKMEMNGILIVIGQNKFNKALLNFTYFKMVDFGQIVKNKTDEVIGVGYSVITLVLFGFIFGISFVYILFSTFISGFKGYSNACNNSGNPELCSQSEYRGNIYNTLIIIASFVAGIALAISTAASGYAIVNT